MKSRSLQISEQCRERKGERHVSFGYNSMGYNIHDMMRSLNNGRWESGWKDG